MNLFVSKITNKYSLQGAGKELGMHQALSYRASRDLIEKGLIISDKNGLYGLNYKENIHELVALEYMRTNKFLNNSKHKRFIEFSKEFMEKIKENNYLFFLFGSAVESDMPRDYDIVLFFDDMEKAQKYENILSVLSKNYPGISIHINVDTINDLIEMIKKRDEKNVGNELLNKHIILYGAEQFYKILREARPYA